MSRIPQEFQSGSQLVAANRPGLQNGAGEESRTPDLRITNALLYQLSYTGKAASRRQTENYIGFAAPSIGSLLRSAILPPISQPVKRRHVRVRPSYARRKST